MKLLLDTHILLWWLDGDSRLPSHPYALIEDRRHSVSISVASKVARMEQAESGMIEATKPRIPLRFIRVKGLMC